MQLNITDSELKNILLSNNYITKNDITGYEDGPLADFLLSKNVLTPDLIGQAMAEHYGVPYADLNTAPPTAQQVAILPKKLAQQYRAVVFKKTDKGLVVATERPRAKGLQAALKKALKGTITIAYALPDDISAAFIHYREPLKTRFSEIVQKGGNVAPELAGQILADAVSFKASDIHFEPLDEEQVRIRFRVDGILQEAGTLPAQHYRMVTNWIKVQAHLRTDEHASMQDGSFSYESDKNAVDIRVSIAPTIEGEKIVLRLLAEYARNFDLGDLGLSERHQKEIIAAAQKPFGMIVVAGPTGSGKTTTLYALMKHVATPGINVMTIEDPVEYRIGGVNHIQVNEDKDITFSAGLRSIVRQDPDVILVGEIRDRETAEIAVNAALTGHMLFSTFHANDAATTIPRLLDMGIESFLLASTLELIIAQRLVRRICEQCRTSHTISAAQLKEYGIAPPRASKKKKITVYRGTGCAACSNTGYRGRVAVYEFIRVTPALKEAIGKNPSAADIRAQADTNDALTMFADGWEKVQNGLTTIDELVRVVPPPPTT